MRSPLVRYAYLTLGWVCVGLGAVGVVVPGMPTVVFLLVAVWAFARSSERFHRWLLAHPRLGPPVVDWQRHGVIRRRAKVAALAFMTLAVAVLVFLAGVPLGGDGGAGRDHLRRGAVRRHAARGAARVGRPSIRPLRGLLGMRERYRAAFNPSPHPE